MSNNKQSSVEWLVSQLKISTYWDTLIAQLELMDLEIDDIIEQAKAMHEQEIKRAFIIGGGVEYHEINTNADEYFIEEFNQ